MSTIAKSGSRGGIPYSIHQKSTNEIKLTFGSKKRTFESWDQAMKWLDDRSVRASE